MMKLIQQFRQSRQFKPVTAGTLLLIATLAWAAENKPKPETPVLSRDAYRTPLDQVLVTGRSAPQQAPRWDKPKVDIPEQVAPSRLQLLPKYSRDERDEYNGVRDTQNPQPRTKLFELKF
jgi:hypothetical protein